VKNGLQPYFSKHDFAVTSEPQGGKASAGTLSFVVQKHAASRLHYDFRLELDGTLKSWAVPKGPSLDPADKRMAVHVEDHPIDYGAFEGIIPRGQYGAGSVIVWDNGSWEPIGDPRAGYRAGKVKFRLHGKKLRGGWTLVRMHGRAGERQEPWLLLKERDEFARPAAEYNVVDAEPASVLSERTIDAAAAAAPAGARVAKAPARGTSSARAKASGRAKESATTSASASLDAPVPPPAGAAKAKLPLTLAPQLATLVAEAPSDAGWTYEIKFDGYRVLARVDDDDVRLYTRRGNDWSARMKGLVAAIRGLGIGSGWLDGEIVVAGAHGAPDFNALQNAFDAARTETIQYFVFDLPYYAGHDLRNVPLRARRATLAALLERAGPQERLRFSQDFDGGAPKELLLNACRMRLEGMIGKRADAPYVSRRSPTWIKLKCTQRQEFVVGGWTEPEGSRTGVGSLLLGIHDEAGRLRFAGGVGSGFDQKALAAVRAALAAIPADETPFFEKPREVRGHWVKPQLVAEVSFGEWTPDGRVRHAVFHGLRDDKDALAITREQPATPAEIDGAAAATPARKTAANKTAARSATKTAAKKSATAETTIGGIRISHPDRVVDPSTGITKLEIVNHYLDVARLMLPHLAKRPVSLVRAPSGLAGAVLFQRHAGTLRIPELRLLDPDVSPDHEPMIGIDSFAALIGAAQANVIEFHTWNATVRDLTRPDRILFDLDPGEGVAWRQMQEGANLTRALLEQLGLKSFLKTSGGKGLHVVVPITPKDDWDTVRALARTIVEHMAQTLPERFVRKSGPKNRVGRIFVDYLRNAFGATTACAWSARARPGIGVSVPCQWDELAALTSGAHWTIRNVHERIEEKSAAWRDYVTTRQTTAKAKQEIGFAPVAA
jgi:bifunctional non-homologous end joining protein LigD